MKKTEYIILTVLLIIALLATIIVINAIDVKKTISISPTPFAAFANRGWRMMSLNELINNIINQNQRKMKSIIKEGKKWGIYYTLADLSWEFHLLPFIDISYWRILCGWLCFTIQYTFKTAEEE